MNERNGSQMLRMKINELCSRAGESIRYICTVSLSRRPTNRLRLSYAISQLFCGKNSWKRAALIGQRMPAFR